jgi:hypothetical protein
MFISNFMLTKIPTILLEKNIYLMTHLLLELSRNFAMLKRCKCVAISDVLRFEFLEIFNRFWSENTEKPINCNKFSTFMPPF